MRRVEKLIHDTSFYRISNWKLTKDRPTMIVDHKYDYGFPTCPLEKYKNLSVINKSD